MPNRLFDLFPGDERQIACPWICGESDTKSLQVRVMLWTEIFLRWDKRGGKSRVCDRTVEREKSSSQANNPEYDRASNWMDSVCQ
jgi:hypothetical protein